MIYIIFVFFWSTSFRMMISSCIHLAANGVILFYGWVVVCCVYIPPLYQLICLWVFRLLLCLGCYKQCCCEYWCACVFEFIFSGYLPRSRIDGPQWNSVCACSVLCTYSIVSHSLQPRGLQPTRLLCPWDSPGRNAGVGCQFLLQGIFPTQGSNPCLLH